MQQPLLEARKLTKRYPGVLALDEVSFSLNSGEVHSLCGENGAGKSTLIKVLGGVIGAGQYEGELFVRGQRVAFANTSEAERANIAVIHQELSLVDGMTVQENIFLGNEPGAWGFVDHREMRRRALALLSRFGLEIDPAALVGQLGMGHKQLVEIARALAKNASVLIFDEPTSALTRREVDGLLAIVKDLVKKGMSAIYISHKMDEVFELSERITVLRDGRSIATLRAAETDEATVVQKMVGRAVEDLFPPKSGRAGETLLEVSGLTIAAGRGEPPMLQGVSLEARAGQVLGIGGLMGAGRSELLMHLFGCFGVATAGNVRFLGQSSSERSPAQHVAAGLVLVTEDRKRFGLSLSASVGFNLSLSALPEFCRLGFVAKGRETARSLELFRALSVKAASLEVAVGTLSGGNQQKVVLGRALMTRPRLILLDEPTRGIDIGAKQEIYRLVAELRERGLGVILVSSELPELLGLADTIHMLGSGKLSGPFDPATATQEQLLSAAM